MEETKKNSPIARILAALALIGTVIILFAVVTGVTGDDDGGSTKKANPDKQRVSGKPKTKKKKYEVEEGDTLTTISRKTGIPVETLERLNPNLDPQALQLGQKIKLR